MEARLRVWRLSRETLLVVAALALLIGAMAVGYGIRAATGASATHTVYVSSGGPTSATQSDAPCVWTGTVKGC